MRRSDPWPSRRPPGPGARHARTAFVTPEQRWRALTKAIRAAADAHVQGPGLWEVMRLARAECAGAPFPVEGEPAKACAMALMEMVRTFPLAGEDQRGWHGASVLALAQQAEVMLDQKASAAMRRMSGERDD